MYGILLKIVVIAVISSLGCFAREDRSVLDRFVPLTRVIKKIVQTNFESVIRSRSSCGIRGHMYQEEVQGSFPCTIIERSKNRPTSVHKLRPGDIDVIGAMGDSLAVGFASEAVTLPEIFHEGRGSSYSIGGEGTWRTYLTLANILKQFNPNIYGYSLNSISIEKESGFNVAEGGAISENMPYMAKVLIKRMKTNEKVNITEDWKMITIQIGHNDFCSEVCYKKNYMKILQEHKTDMLEVLRIFRDNLPRTIVNFLPPLHLRPLLEMTDAPSLCKTFHLFACSCIKGLPHAHLRAKILELMTNWQILDREISNYQEFDREDFTVIFHDFVLNYPLFRSDNGRIDYKYFAPDCFHFSQKGHAKCMYGFL
ncbi:hypothetical protein ABEB36_012153 [Hypothenemus hampei]|uniref:Phospholipase B1, membrane-associated n=1 Tax=Hypothenemus hampei TaxID=57062 RepID=A0ABD1EAJ4_HYPHA